MRRAGVGGSSLRDDRCLESAQVGPDEGHPITIEPTTTTRPLISVGRSIASRSRPMWRWRPCDYAIPRVLRLDFAVVRCSRDTDLSFRRQESRALSASGPRHSPERLPIVYAKRAEPRQTFWERTCRNRSVVPPMPWSLARRTINAMRRLVRLVLDAGAWLDRQIAPPRGSDHHKRSEPR